MIHYTATAAAYEATACRYEPPCERGELLLAGFAMPTFTYHTLIRYAAYYGAITA